MAFDSKVIKVFIACPYDSNKYKSCVRSAMAFWNEKNSEEYGIVYLPYSWDKNLAPEYSKPTQDYINEALLDKCDLLIALFWTTIGSPSGREKSASIGEVTRHASFKKRTLVYFSNESIEPGVLNDKNYKNYRELTKWKESIKDISLFREFCNVEELRRCVIDDLTSLARERKYRVLYDSDKIAMMTDDEEIVSAINSHVYMVSANLIKLIYAEEHDVKVWKAMVDRLGASPADLRDSLTWLARQGAFKHQFYTLGYRKLADNDQTSFGTFMSELYSINKFEFKSILDEGLFEECPFKEYLLNSIRERESGIKGKRIIV